MVGTTDSQTKDNLDQIQNEVTTDLEGPQSPNSNEKAQNPLCRGDIGEAIAKNKPIILYRDKDKGLGDIISLLSAVEHLKTQIPNAIVYMQLREKFFPLVERHPLVGGVFDLGNKVDGLLVDMSSVCADEESASLNNSRTVKQSRNQIFVEHLGLRYNWVAPQLYLNEDKAHRTNIGNLLYKNSEGYNIGLVLRSAEKWKDYPHNELLAKLLCKDDHNVHTLDQTKKLKYDHSNLHAITSLQLEGFLSLVSMFDLIISPDTGTLHIAEALQVPAIGLFGSMGTKRRSDAYQLVTTKYLTSSTCNRQPCFYTRCKGVNQFQPCMEIIHPMEIASLATKLLNEEE